MAKQSQVKSRRKVINPVFHLQTQEEDDGQLTLGMIKVVRRTGQLNLSGRSLAKVPIGIFKMYETSSDALVTYDMSKGTDDAWWTYEPLTYIDLSSNVLTSIPEGIQIFEDLAILNLHDNNLTSLPKEIGALRKLTKLNLSHNKLNVLPVEFCRLTDLQQLNLSHNCIEELNDEFVDLVMLQTLDLSFNQLTQLPAGFGFLVRIADLNLAHNKLVELPSDLSSMRALLKLDVTHNNLKLMPNMSGLRRLLAVHALHNDIEELPLFEGCEQLQELHFANNFIKEVTMDFCESVPGLKVLDLKDNKIENLAKEIAMLQHLIRLNLMNNDLETLPNTMGLLTHLQNLQLEGNKLTHIRQDILKGGTNRLLKYLKDRMDSEDHATHATNEFFGSPEARTFPDKYMMKNSRALNLSMKDLANIPDSVFEDAFNAEVNIVDLSKNKITEVPEGLNIISNLTTELNLSTNKIRRLPSFTMNFCRLQYLDIGNNQLNSLPNDLGKLINLRELVLSNNMFAEIPTSVYNLLALEILLVSNNQIRSINVDGLMNLKKIATLDLSNNNIDFVPLELGNINQLRSLELKGNSFRMPRYAILEQGTETILCYLRDRIPK